MHAFSKRISRKSFKTFSLSLLLIYKKPTNKENRGKNMEELKSLNEFHNVL